MAPQVDENNLGPSIRTASTMSSSSNSSRGATRSQKMRDAKGRSTQRIVESQTNLTRFRELPPYESFTRVSWAMVVCQIIAGICGAILSYFSKNGVIGGIMSGIVGLWFVQMSWVMAMPSKTSSTPYYVGLLLLPLNKSIGFLVLGDWKEFLRRMAILISMWVFPMYLAGIDTAEVVRCVHGDVSRYDPYGERENGNIFATRRQHATGMIDGDGIEIRQRAMACTVKYIVVLPMVIYISFNAIGAIVEAGDYAKYTTMDEDSFEVQTGKQFYVDFMRMAYSSIFQGLVAVFTLITISGFSCSGMDLGEIMRFRFHVWELAALGANLLFFVAGVFFGSALFNPLSATQDKLAYWTIFVLPCVLMLCLWRLTTGVLMNKNKLRIQRLESEEEEDALLSDGGATQRRRSVGMFGVPGYGFEIGNGGPRSSGIWGGAAMTAHILGSDENPASGRNSANKRVSFDDDCADPPETIHDNESQSEDDEEAATAVQVQDLSKFNQEEVAEDHFIEDESQNTSLDMGSEANFKSFMTYLGE